LHDDLAAREDVQDRWRDRGEEGGVSLVEVEGQTRRHASGLPKDAQLAAWRRDEPLAFRYESTGAETRFTNRLEPDASSREVFGFRRPRRLSGAMARADAEPAMPTLVHRSARCPSWTAPCCGRTRSTPCWASRDPCGVAVPGRLYGDRCGTTFTAVTATYRLGAHAGASRVLFVVDRNNFGEQAEREFTNYTGPDDGRRFGDLYNVQRLAGRRVNDVPDDDAEVDVEGMPEESAAPVDIIYNAAIPPGPHSAVLEGDRLGLCDPDCRARERLQGGRLGQSVRSARRSGPVARQV
jgi:type I restriction enzyme R subunit